MSMDVEKALTTILETMELTYEKCNMCDPSKIIDYKGKSYEVFEVDYEAFDYIKRKLGA